MDMPTYTPPPLLPEKPQIFRAPRALLVGGALVLLILIVIVIVSLPGVRNFLALRGIALASADYLPGPALAFSLNGTKEARVPADGPLIDYAQAGSQRAVITQTTDGTRVSVGDTILVTDASSKAGVAIDRSGKHVAYAVSAGESERAVYLNLNEWLIRYHDLERGEMINLGPGFSPEFFMRDGKNYLLFSAPNGLTFFDVDERRAITVPFTNLDSSAFAASVSPDGRYIAARNLITEQHDLYMLVTFEGSFRLSALGTIPRIVSDVAWKGGTLYTVGMPENGMVDVSSVPVSDPTKVRVLRSFASETQYRLIP